MEDSEVYYCYSCSHPCHCEDDSCESYVGIGLSDKDTTCGCEECRCKFPDRG